MDVCAGAHLLIHASVYDMHIMVYVWLWDDNFGWQSLPSLCWKHGYLAVNCCICHIRHTNLCLPETPCLYLPYVITIGGPGIQMCGSHSAWHNEVYGNSNSSSPACKALYAVSHLPRSALHFRKGSTSLLMCFQTHIGRGTVEHSPWLSSVSVWKEPTTGPASLSSPSLVRVEYWKGVHHHWTYGSHVNIGTV